MEKSRTKNKLILFGRFHPLTASQLKKLLNYVNKPAEKITIVILKSKNDLISSKIRYQWIFASLKDFIKSNIANIEIKTVEKSQFSARISKKPAVLKKDSKIEYIDFDKYSDFGKYSNLNEKSFFKNPLHHYDFLPNIVKPFFNKKVLIIGTESTGKSTLAIALAKYFNTQYIPEIGRDISQRAGDTLQMTDNDYIEIFLRHTLEMIKRNRIANKILFCDTDCIDTLFWYEATFPKPNKTIYNLAYSVRSEYDAIIYLHPVNKWVADGTRQFYKERNKHNIKLLQMIKAAYPDSSLYELKGSFEQNYKDSLKIAENLFK
ncbi:MAG: ATP-binding protein [Bifidobacteriaceae bacterium]|jgi:HTH-type transcriptional repressor of NAD biosynthesis genes|nr:ATP-binding protein [Bifidobacteriaceae bacterium]